MSMSHPLSNALREKAKEVRSLLPLQRTILSVAARDGFMYSIECSLYSFQNGVPRGLLRGGQ
jgi:hypothetical protein